MGHWELCRVGMGHWELWRVGMDHWELMSAFADLGSTTQTPSASPS